LPALDDKLTKLDNILETCHSTVIGFSGGVDSSLLAAAAYRVLKDKAVAVTACSETLPESEKREAKSIADSIGINHVYLNISELDNPEFVANNRDRCYFCKKTRFSALANWAEKSGYEWVLEGSNADDISDYRPGMRAVDEMNKVRSPLLEAGLTKEDIRAVAHRWGVPSWNKPSAACLSSRVAYGQSVTAEKLRQIEQAEIIVKKFCSGQVRVRHHGNIARIEISPESFPVMADASAVQEIYREIRKLGFTYVTLDLGGYRTGSMNDEIRK
jgi:uncharacterized protein